MDSSNLVETVVHYLPIGGMAYLDRRNCFLMASALVFTIPHWIGHMVNHDIRRLSIVMIHQVVILDELLTLRRYQACVEVNRRL